jgi:hypothetical protein
MLFLLLLRPRCLLLPALLPLPAWESLRGHLVLLLLLDLLRRQRTRLLVLVLLPSRCQLPRGGAAA